MTAITFPNSPSSGDTHTAGNGIVYTYDGEKWTSIGTNSAGTWTRSGTTVSLTNAGDDLNVDSGTFFVDASTNNVGVGTTSFTASSSGRQILEINGTSSALINLDAGGTRNAYIYSDASETYFYNTQSGPLILGTNNTQQMRIDSAGRLLIKTTSAGSNGTADDLIVANNTSASDQAGITIRGGTSGRSQIFFSDGTSGDAEYRGMLRYDHSEDSMQFRTAATERLRIDSAGTITAAGSIISGANPNLGGNSGVQIVSDGIVRVAKASGNIFEAWTTGSSTRKVAINSNGTVNAAGNVNSTSDSVNTASLVSAGYVLANRTSGSASVFSGQLNGSQTAGITADGSATFAGSVEISNSSTSNELQFKGTDYTNVYSETTAGFDIGINSTSSAYLRFLTNNTERLRIRSDGQILVGSSSSTYNVISNQNTAARLHLSGGGSGSANIDLHGATHSSDAKVITFDTNSSERMRIDSSGNVGIKTSNPSHDITVGGNNEVATVCVRYSTVPAFITNSFDGTLGLTTFSNNTSNTSDASSSWSSFANTGYSAAAIQLISSNHSVSEIRFSTATTSNVVPTERMRIEGSGYKRLHSQQSGVIIGSAASAGTTHTLLSGVYSQSGITTGGTTSFKVFTNGNVQNTNDSYGQISDIKLKENIVDAGSQWDDFKAVRFRKYNFKEETGYETHTQLGVIAQELELTSPGLVYETADKDEDGNDLGTTTKAVKSSILTKKALVALQEAMARIETLEAEVAALKSA